MTATLSERTEVPVRRGVLTTLTHRDGDMPISWDPANPDEVRTAREAFNRLVRTHVIYAVGEGGEREQVRDFDPHAARFVAVPPLQGG